MTVKELIEKLKACDPNADVMTKKTELFGNVGCVNTIRNDSYSFFGTAIPCVLLTDEYEDGEGNWNGKDDK